MGFSVGKNAIIVSTGEQNIAFFNSNITEQMVGEYQFYLPDSEDDAEPLFKVNISQDGNKRCLTYNTFVPNSAKIHNFNIVLCSTGKGGFQPLFEAINISPSYDPQKHLISATFWSNLKQNTTSQVVLTEDELNPNDITKSVNIDNGNIKRRERKGKVQWVQFRYDPEKIHKFQHEKLDQLQWGETFNIIFVSISMYLEPYRVRKAGMTDAISNLPIQNVVIVRQKPTIIDEKTDLYPIVDFVTGGNGNGGMKQHSHIPNIDGTNFAFAVFHPGTSMPQLPWET